MLPLLRNGYATIEALKYSNATDKVNAEIMTSVLEPFVNLQNHWEAFRSGVNFPVVESKTDLDN